MNCQERQDQILLYVAGALEPAEGDELRAHLASGCPTCAATIAEAQEVIASLPLSLRQAPAPAGARDRLMQRVLANSRSTSSRSRFEPRAVFAIISTLAAAIAIVIALQFRHAAEIDRTRLASAEFRLNELVNQIQNKDADFRQLQLALAGARESNEIVRAKNLQLVSLGGEADQPQASGRVLYDRDDNKWHVSVFDLKPLPADKAYQLWFIAPGKDPVPAPLINIDSTGHGSLVVDVPKNIGNVTVAAITIEKAGGDVSPHSKPQLVGKVQ